MSRKLVYRWTALAWLLLYVACHASEPLIIGIAGGSGSGKTTFASEIQQILGDDLCVVVHADDYYKPNPPAGTDFDSPDAIEFDLLHAHLLALKEGQSIQSPCYDFGVTDRIGVKQLDAKKIVIVEGFLLFVMPEIRDLLGVTIFLDADSDILCLRRLERDLLVLNQPFPQTKEYYLNRVKPGFEKFIAPTKQYADFVINTGAPKDQIIDQIVQIINHLN